MAIKFRLEMILSYFTLFMLIWSFVAFAIFHISGGLIFLFDFYIFMIVFWFVFPLAVSPVLALSGVFFLLAIGIFLPILFSESVFLDESFVVSLVLSAVLSLSFVTTYKVIVRRRVRYGVAEQIGS